MLESVQFQLNQQVELITYHAHQDRSIGFRRNEALKMANGRFTCFADDDDTLSHHYIYSLLHATKDSPDCIGFKLNIFTDNKLTGESIHSLKYKQMYEGVTMRDGQKIKQYQRPINHLNPVRTEIAQHVGFPDKVQMEDYAYSEALMPLLEKEVFVNEYVYNYLWIPHHQRTITKRIA